MIGGEVDRGCEGTLAAMVAVGARVDATSAEANGGRRFTELDLREMLEGAEGYRTDIVEGRFVIDTRHRRKRWEVIVEPDPVVTRLVVVTAYPLGR